jgi:hypothetical protein
VRTTTIFAVVAVMLSSLVVGCATNSSGEVNPSYTGPQITRLAIGIGADDQETALLVEARAIETFKEYGVVAEGFTKYIPFETFEEIGQRVVDAGHEYGLLAGSEQKRSNYNTGQSTCTSNFVGGATCTEQTSISRRTYTAATLFEVDTLDVIWQGQGKRASSGYFAVFDFEAEADVIDEVIEEISRDGIIPPKLED